MASTNKTTNILLSQFLGTDHFSFLTDYNGDMLKIDTYCGNLKALVDETNSQITSLNQFKTAQTTVNANVAESIEDVNRVVKSANESASEAKTGVDAMQTRVSTLEVNNDKASNAMKQYAYEATKYGDLSGATKSYILPKLYIKDTTGVMNVEMSNASLAFSSITTVLGTDFTAVGTSHFLELPMADYNDGSWKDWITRKLNKTIIGTYKIGEINYIQVVDIDGVATDFQATAPIVMSLGEGKVTFRIYNTDDLIQFGASTRNVVVTGGLSIQL